MAVPHVGAVSRQIVGLHTNTTLYPAVRLPIDHPMHDVRRLAFTELQSLFPGQTMLFSSMHACPVRV